MCSTFFHISLSLSCRSKHSFEKRHLNTLLLRGLAFVVELQIMTPWKQNLMPNKFGLHFLTFWFKFPQCLYDPSLVVLCTFLLSGPIKKCQNGSKRSKNDFFQKKMEKMYQDFVMRSTPKNVTRIVHARKKECKK